MALRHLSVKSLPCVLYGIVYLRETICELELYVSIYLMVLSRFFHRRRRKTYKYADPPAGGASITPPAGPEPYLRFLLSTKCLSTSKKNTMETPTMMPSSSTIPHRRKAALPLKLVGPTLPLTTSDASMSAFRHLQLLRQQRRRLLRSKKAFQSVAAQAPNIGAGLSITLLMTSSTTLEAFASRLNPGTVSIWSWDEKSGRPVRHTYKSTWN